MSSRPTDIRRPRVCSGRRLPWPLVFVALFVTLVAGADAQTAALTGAVVRVVDGDTIHVQLGPAVEKVRYIDIDTPETRHPTKGAEPGGREATEANRVLVEGRRVFPRPDPLSSITRRTPTRAGGVSPG